MKRLQLCIHWHWVVRTVGFAPFSILRNKWASRDAQQSSVAVNILICSCCSRSSKQVAMSPSYGSLVYHMARLQAGVAISVTFTWCKSCLLQLRCSNQQSMHLQHKQCCGLFGGHQPWRCLGRQLHKLHTQLPKLAARAFPYCLCSILLQRRLSSVTCTASSISARHNTSLRGCL